MVKVLNVRTLNEDRVVCACVCLLETGAVCLSAEGDKVSKGLIITVTGWNNRGIPLACSN